MGSATAKKKKKARGAAPAVSTPAPPPPPAANATVKYAWRAPISRRWDHRTARHVRIRGIMNTGTNFLRTLLAKVGALKITEERKHMFPWVLEARGAAAPPRSSAVIIARHPLSWVTGMRKAPYFLDCKSTAPDARCWMRLVYKANGKPEKIDRRYDSIVAVWNAYYAGYLEWRGSTGAPRPSRSRRLRGKRTSS